MDSRKLKAKMIMTDTDRTSICNALGISTAAYHRKMRGKSEFKQGEIAAISKLMNMTNDEIADIFFGKKVS